MMYIKVFFNILVPLKWLSVFNAMKNILANIGIIATIFSNCYHFMKIINFISGKDLGGTKQSFVLYSKVLTDLYPNKVISVIKKHARFKRLLGNQNNIIEVDYWRADVAILRNIAVNVLQQKLAPIKADIIFVHKQIDVKLISLALPNIKIIAVVHGFNANFIEYAKHIITPSNKVKQFLQQHTDTQISIVPNMVQISDNAQYRDLPDVPLIGAMGVFRRKKGFHILIQALGILKQQNIPFKAVIAGSKDRMYWYLRYLQWRLNLQQELTITGWINNQQRDDFIDKIDLYILPSRTESFGMVVVEAMARKKRVIATKCGGPEEIITNNYDGYLVKKQNPKALAQQIIKLLNSPTNSNYIPENAYKTAHKYHTTNVADAISSVIKIVLNQ